MSKSHDFITNQEKLALTSHKSYFDIQALTRSVLTHLEKSIFLNYAFRHKSTLAVPKYFPQKVW